MIRTLNRPDGFDHVSAWIFDLDNTLYPADCNLFAEIDQRMGAFIAERYAPLIDALYDDSSEADISTEVTFEDGRKGVISARVKIRDMKVYPIESGKVLEAAE